MRGIVAFVVVAAATAVASQQDLPRFRGGIDVVQFTVTALAELLSVESSIVSRGGGRFLQSRIGVRLFQQKDGPIRRPNEVRAAARLRYQERRAIRAQRLLSGFYAIRKYSLAENANASNRG